MSDARHTEDGRDRAREGTLGVGFTSGVIGTVLVLAGLLYFFHVMGWFPWTDVDPWDLWPLVLVVIGVQGWINTRGLARIVSAGVAVAGGALLAQTLGFAADYWPQVRQWMSSHGVDPRALWAGLIVLVGLLVLAGGMHRRQRRAPGGGLRQVAIFGGAELNLEGESTGGWVLACFGGVELDLTGCTISADEVRVDFIAMFGGGEIKVPPHWRVTVGGVPVLGGFSNDTKHQPIEGRPSPHLVVNGVTMCGGFSVEN